MPTDNKAPQDPGDRATIAALIFVVLLVILCIWVFSELKSNNDLLNCVLSGRKNCAPLTP
jgi:hypothetical protein